MPGVEAEAGVAEFPSSSLSSTSTSTTMYPGLSAAWLPTRASLHHLLGHPLPALIELPCRWPISHSPSLGASGRGNEKDEEEETTDLFLLSLTHPILLFCFPPLPPPKGTPSTPSYPSFLPHLESLCFNLERIKGKEKRNTGEDLKVFGLTWSSSSSSLGSSSSEQASLAEAVPNQLPLPILSDEGGRMVEALELPTFLPQVDDTFPSTTASTPSGNGNSKSTIPPGPQTQSAGTGVGIGSKGLLCHFLLLLRGGQVVRFNIAEPPHSLLLPPSTSASSPSSHSHAAGNAESSSASAATAAAEEQRKRQLRSAQLRAALDPEKVVERCEEMLRSDSELDRDREREQEQEQEQWLLRSRT